MGKSISLNKKEREKKREQKRQEKQKRKKERQTNSSNGSLKDMIAYVDENGVITDTPPTSDNKHEVDAENIAVSTPKKGKTEEILLKGRVEHFNPQKGYGFIKDIDSIEKYFFHISDAFPDIAEGTIVSFELKKGHKGMNAVKIHLQNKKTDEL